MRRSPANSTTVGVSLIAQFPEAGYTPVGVVHVRDTLTRDPVTTAADLLDRLLPAQ